MVSVSFHTERPPMIVRFRKAAKAVCKAVRNSKIDGRIGLRDLLQRKDDLSGAEDMGNNSHLLSLDALEIWYKKPSERTSSDLDYLERGVALLKCMV
jgi:hypothetical protein